MYDAKIIKLLTEMKMNCLNGTAYDDPLRGDKAEALNYAIFAVNAVSGDYRWHDLRKNPDDVPKENGHYLIVYQWIGKNSGITVETYSPYDGFHTPPEYPCIAWKEIEPFEVAE